MWLFIFTITIFSVAQAQTFQDFINKIHGAPDSTRGFLVDNFFYDVETFPLIEQDSIVHFIFRGNASRVTIPGDANNWQPDSFSMKKVDGTNLWFYSHCFEPNARLDYKYSLNDQYWITDPLNPLQIAGGHSVNSELRMPAYEPAPELRFYDDIAHGSIIDTNFFSISLNNSRKIKVYIPPHYHSSSNRYPIALFHDGLDYLTFANVTNVLDFLISKQKIKPLIAVFIPPVNRQAEYAGDLKAQFSQFIVFEVMSWVDNKFRTLKKPEFRATIGVSSGGNISLWLGIHYPEIFGNIAAQSSYVEDRVTEIFQQDTKLPLKIYLDMGAYDIPHLIPVVRDLVIILKERGYQLQYYEFPEGHSWGNWAAHIKNSLVMFFPY